ncbi:hypothetical protein BO78DRAFT_350651 [Aspergillus sclerotiicarbonarius CBS 121057]|uniref:Thioesterase domain-containing protein n=1 Tax=Aspergillus sclerotiicarbonarius (strain CBS 121057 / IBT 28362) TaxID=1448318 RepID=A0A319DYY5_ASPSB|nr:hypothetical protein BO78DRAFT_350651 [Aspergillus sclerotiicarbonarius CBS 121057]
MFSSRTFLQSPLRLFGNRPQLPCRYTFRASRHTSTAAHEPLPQPSRWPRRLAYAAIFSGLGVAAGKWMDGKFAAPPLPGTEEDGKKLEEIHFIYEHGLPIVKELREHPDYIEADVYGNYTEEDKLQRLSSGPLRGSRGLALQKIFYNDKEKKAINVAYVGPGLEGWPTVVHGGALGTVIDEHLARVAIRHLPQRTGVTANLQLKYRAPVYSGNFYTFHATLDEERSTERKAWVNGEVRNPVGRLCIEATGLFVVPKTYKLQEVGERY